MDNDLKKLLPMGEAASRSTLLKSGIKSYTLDNYLRSGKFKLLNKGVYCWKEQLPTWQGLIASLPSLTQQKVIVGGISALELQGYSHYLNVNAVQTIHLYSDSHIPQWIKALFISLQSVKIIWHSTGHLWAKEESADNGILIRDVQNYRFSVSIPERAILELLSLLPDQFSFEHTNEVFQGLTQLSPNKMSAILMKCKSIKVKRLFFWFADKYNYPWRVHINEKEYALGTGKRVIANDGVFDKKYNITVPRTMQEDL